MQQPELGKRLTELRKEKNLTQEELVEKSHVSVRTIQRIESGEVMPRLSTVKILWEALGEKFESNSTKPVQVMETPKRTLPNANRMTLLIAALSGAVYLICQIILCSLDIAWYMDEGNWSSAMDSIYIALTASMIISYALFARGFIALSTVFENTLLKSVTWMLMIATAGFGVLNVFSLTVEDVTALWLPYMMAAVLFGTLGIVFGIALIRLQDSMGELSRVAGVLEIIMGCLLITVVLFFISYLVMIPAVVVEILVLYRGYEYLSRPEPEYTNG